MRLLLLLSAFLTALSGAVVGTSASAQPIEASASTGHVKPGSAVKVAAPLPEEVRGAFAAPGTWRAYAPLITRAERHSFGERRRE
ncbi:MAG TPA: hypothetical protein VNT42_07155 [Sphingomonas sp.]|nr:hypothetical protein [Sphingomonas sp.]